MRIETSLQARQEMQLKLAPQIIQSIEILQLPIIELEKRIEQELEENPLLETQEGGSEATAEEESEPGEEDDSAVDSVLVSEEQQERQFERLDELTEYYRSYSDERPAPDEDSTSGKGAKQEALENSPNPDPTLHEHLETQLAGLTLDEPLNSICLHIVANLDERGYLAATLQEILDSIDGRPPSEQGEKALKIVQSLEPPGIAARDIKECLLLQLDPRDDDCELAAAIIQDHFDDIMNNRIPKVAADTGFGIDAVNAAVQKLGTLNPRPGTLFFNQTAPHVLPDVTIQDNDGHYQIVLENAWLPSLRISAYYARRLQEKNLDEKTRQYLTGKLNAAQGIISAIEQRRATLENVTEEIVKAQKEFFDRGEMHLKPLKMQDVADRVGIHVSTVSRAIANKYVQTPQGIYSLKRFFTGGTRKDDGDLESWDVVRKKLLDIVHNENKKKPFSDEAIAARLKNQGIDIARRTVAKYRKALDIPSSRMRREF